MRKNAITALLVVSAFVAGAAAHAAAPRSRDQKARRLIELTGGEALSRQMVASMLEHFASMPDLPKGFSDEFKQNAAKDDLASRLVPVYGKHLLEADMDTAIAFFDSPAGHNFTAAQPKIIEDSQRVGDEWGRELSDKTLRDLQTRKSPPKK